MSAHPRRAGDAGTRAPHQTARPRHLRSGGRARGWCLSTSPRWSGIGRRNRRWRRRADHAEPVRGDRTQTAAARYAIASAARRQWRVPRDQRRAGLARLAAGAPAGTWARRALSVAVLLSQLHAGVDDRNGAWLSAPMQILFGVAVLWRVVPLPRTGNGARRFRKHGPPRFRDRRPFLGQPPTKRGTGRCAAPLARAEGVDAGAVESRPGGAESGPVAPVASAGKQVRHLF